MKKQKVYDFFFPSGKKIRFRKTRWTIMIIFQEAMMGKWKSIAKFYYKKSYRKDIKHLRDILSKGKLSARKIEMKLGDINYSHEINYPDWVDKLINDLKQDPDNYKRIKVFNDNGNYIVIDGNHRLKALNEVFSANKLIKVLFLTYK